MVAGRKQEDQKLVQSAMYQLLRRNHRAPGGGGGGAGDHPAGAARHRGGAVEGACDRQDGQGEDHQVGGIPLTI